MCATETGIKVWQIKNLDPAKKETRSMKEIFKYDTFHIGFQIGRVP